MEGDSNNNSNGDKLVNADNNSENGNNNSELNESHRHSSVSSDSNSAILRSKISTLFRPSFVNRVSNRRSKSPSVLVTVPSIENIDKAIVPVVEKKPFIKESRGWNTIVTVVLIEAKGLPDVPADGSKHNLFCKIRLGCETFKSKPVPNTSHPEWRERFDLHLYKDNLLKMSIWDKGKQKNFMGSTVVDISKLERERTHEIWQQLDDGFGRVRLSITMCQVRNRPDDPQIHADEGVVKAKNVISSFKSDWKLVGQLYVKVIGAKGLSGKPNAYCTLELDNERVQTHSARASSEPNWDKSYIFNVYDVTSTLDLKLYDNSLVNSLRNESLGRVSIPLLRIQNGETRWFALKDRSKRHIAKGNCPRVQLEMTIFWNPVKATARLFQPKEVKHIKKPPKFDVALVYSNMQFVRDTFNVLYDTNEQFKRLFEWENKELSFTVLVGWLMFWLYFRMWATPLLLLAPFLYYWITQPNLQERSTSHSFGTADDSPEQSDNDKGDKGLTGKIQGLQEMTLTITGGVEYSVSLAERLYNLASFKVPFLSFLTMMLLVGSSIAFYIIPFNYMMMAFGIYKFSRKYLNPDRMYNNDLLDFISRIPDNEILKDWKELNVPEPSMRRPCSIMRSISDSSA